MTSHLFSRVAEGMRTPSFERSNRSAEAYEEEGRRFYRLAQEHRDARVLNLAEVLGQLHERFNLARKAINYISDNFLQLEKRRLFPYVSPN